MPTLRDDINEAIERASEARTQLVIKLERNIAWDKDDKITSIEGLDSLIDLSEEVLPYIPKNVARKGESSMASLKSVDPAPIIPGADQDMYGTKFTYSGGTIHNGTVFNIGHTAWPVFPTLPEGYDESRPNILLDGTRKVWNFSGTDWTGDNAGSTKRECMIEVFIDLAEDQWGDLLVYAHNDGDGNRVIAQGKNPGHFEKYEIRGSESQFQARIPVSLSGPPRGGVWDWLQMCIEFVPYEGSKELTIRNGWMKFFLPGTRSNHFRNVNIVMVNEEMTTLSSVDEVREHDGFLYFVGDHGYPLLILNAMDVRGFWFERLHGAKYGYTVESHKGSPGSPLKFRADDLPLAGERFAIMRGATVEGWVAADSVHTITPEA